MNVRTRGPWLPSVSMLMVCCEVDRGLTRVGRQVETIAALPSTILYAQAKDKVSVKHEQFSDQTK